GILLTPTRMADLEEDASREESVGIVELPAASRRIVERVRDSASWPKPSDGVSAFGIVELDGEDRILYASPAARALFATTSGGEEPEHLAEILEPSSYRALEERRSEGWIDVAPRVPRPQP